MTRSRDLGIPFNGSPGPFNAITDVAGVEVGYTTLISGGDSMPGSGPAVRTGVTAILPRGKSAGAVFAGWYSFNGCGEMTGTAWIEESGFLESGIALTSTSALGVVYGAMTQWALRSLERQSIRDIFWFLPVVAETTDFFLSDTAGLHIRPEHVWAAFDRAASGPLAEGNVGGGTGMISHDFKGGTGTASRRLAQAEGGYTLGVLVQANHGAREDLTIAGAPVGLEITDHLPELQAERPEPGSGSIIVIIATDAPLLPHQLKRLARRAPLGIGRVGGLGGNTSGDLILAFSTANPVLERGDDLLQADFLPNSAMNALFRATVQATEEAIVNALVAAETMAGVNHSIAYALPHDRLQAVLKKYKRLRR